MSLMTMALTFFETSREASCNSLEKKPGMGSPSNVNTSPANALEYDVELERVHLIQHRRILPPPKDVVEKYGRTNYPKGHSHKNL